MAINEYMNPVKDTFQQDYVSQYIPLPFREMQNALNVKQKQYDDNEALKATISDQIAKVKAMPGKDSEDRDAILSSYENEMNSLIESVGNDYSKIGPELRTLANKAKVDLTRGNLAKINKTGQYWEDSLKTTDEMMSKGDRIAPLEQRYRQNILGQHNLKGGTLGGSSFMYNLTPTADVQGAFQKYAEPIKADIEEYNRLLNDEKLKISGYNTRDKIKIKQRLANRIKNTVASLAKNDPKLAGYFDYINNAGLSSDELIENLASATGNQFAYKEVTRDLKDVKDRMFDEETGAKKTTGQLYAEILGDMSDSSPFRNIKQADLAVNINNNKENISNILGYSPSPTISNSKLFNDLDKQVEKELITPNQATQVLKLQRDNELSESQQKYEVDSYFNSEEGKSELNNTVDFLKSKGIPGDIAQQLILSGKPLTSTESFFNILLSPVESIREAFGSNELLKNISNSDLKMIKENINHPFIKTRISDLRDKIDSFAETNNLKKNTYQPIDIGNSVEDTKIRKSYSKLDNDLTYISQFLNSHVNNLKFVDETGNDANLKDWIDNESAKFIEKNPKAQIDIDYFPTNIAGKDYVFKAVLKDKTSGVSSNKYVKLDDVNAGRQMYAQLASDMIDSGNPYAQKRGYNLAATMAFPEVDKIVIKQALKGNNETKGYPITVNGDTYLINFKKNADGTVSITNSNFKEIENKYTKKLVTEESNEELVKGNSIDDALTNLYLNIYNQ